MEQQPLTPPITSEDLAKKQKLEDKKLLLLIGTPIFILTVLVLALGFWYAWGLYSSIADINRLANP